MKKQYKIQLPKGKKVTMTNVNFENGVMIVDAEFENDFHKAIHDEVCGVFSKINNQLKEALKANGATIGKIEEMAKESIKELEKDCPDIWDKMIKEYGEAICGKTEQKYEPKDGDFISFGTGLISIFKNTGKYWFNNYATLCGDCLTLFKEGWVGENIRPATEEEKKLLIDKLAEAGKRWNSETKRIEEVRWRAKEDEIFYVVAFNARVDSIKDSHNWFTDLCYETGNYFKTREAAEKVAEQIREIFKSSKA